MACSGNATFTPSQDFTAGGITSCKFVHGLMQPQDAYGLEKLASEELAKHYDNDFGIECRVAR